MSSPEALAAVTAALKDLLSPIIVQVDNITTKPPSTARNGIIDEQLNIFLYSVYYNPAFRNEPMPGRAKNGEPAYPPMPLILKYLITAYGHHDDDISGQQIMGRAMSILHDHPILSKAELKSISPDSDLHRQSERIRITPDTLSLDDMSKLWSSFQSAEYRLSAGYEVSVVLIESRRTGRAPLPVLKRGREDQGVHTFPGQQPFLTGLRFLKRFKGVDVQMPSAELNATVTLQGEHLRMENTTVRLEHPLLDQPIDILPASVENGKEMQVPLGLMPVKEGSDLSGPAGFYTLCLLIRHGKTVQWTSNKLALPLAPTVEKIDLVVTGPPGETKTVFLTIKCKPQVRPGQEVMLLFTDQIISPESGDPSISSSDSLEFIIRDVKPGTYVVRLRVDGVDSIPIDFSGNTPSFGDSQKVTVT